MDDIKITSTQLVLFAVILSFVVSVIGTVLALGVLGPLFGFVDDRVTPFVFNRPKEKITERIQEKIGRPDDLIIKVVEDASPAVVSIVATKDVPVVERYYVHPFDNDPLFKEFFKGEGGELGIPQYRQKGTEKQEVSLGSGFLVSADGMIVTNKHVVADKEAEYTAFLNDGSKHAVRVLARDPVLDLAIVKIEGTNYPMLRLGNSSAVKIGQSVIAIGNALGEFQNTVSVGVVSGLHRSIRAIGPGTSAEDLQELIQTDAAINPGNSGGPLLNLDGEVIGINTAMAQGAENIGFATPANKAKKDLASVRKTGTIVYPFLGVRYTLITKEIAGAKKLGRDYGVLLAGTASNPAVIFEGPAGKAGLKEGDIILSFGGTRLTPKTTLASVVQQHNVGDEVILRIFREGAETDIKVTLGERK